MNCGVSNLARSSFIRSAHSNGVEIRTVWYASLHGLGSWNFASEILQPPEVMRSALVEDYFARKSSELGFDILRRLDKRHPLFVCNCV